MADVGSAAKLGLSSISGCCSWTTVVMLLPAMAEVCCDDGRGGHSGDHCALEARLTEHG